MAVDRTKDQHIQQSRTLAKIKPSTGISLSTGVDFSVETEISDETLEAVAGGVVTNPNSMPVQVDQS